MVSDFFDWTAGRKMTGRFNLSSKKRQGGPSIDDETRWAAARRLLHDDALDLADRVAGSLVLLYGQQLSRIAALRRDQVALGADGVTRLSLGTTAIEVPPPLDGLLLRLVDEHRHHTAFSAPVTADPWLFPGMQPGRPLMRVCSGLGSVAWASSHKPPAGAPCSISLPNSPRPCSPGHSTSHRTPLPGG